MRCYNDVGKSGTVVIGYVERYGILSLLFETITTKTAPGPTTATATTAAATKLERGTTDVEVSVGGSLISAPVESGA